jgi:hypothetical protein
MSLGDMDGAKNVIIIREKKTWRGGAAICADAQMSVAQAGVAAPFSPPPPKQSSMVMPAAMSPQLWLALAVKAPPSTPAAITSAARMTMNGRAQRNIRCSHFDAQHIPRRAPIQAAGRAEP